ncbi:conserved hypothetical protein [Candidatus Sulfopaludibacter sp. SbA4]|nr:conserved hypothetical protein [Candidatus Sulfopaludibacter sp. SbA4]
MKEDRDGHPLTGSSSRTLGVRIDGPSRDILVALDGTVSPGTGGMSVALDAAQNLPKHRLPKSLGGEGRDPVFKMPSAALPASLLVRTDRHPHAFVEPAVVCLFEHYKNNLWGTRVSWSNAHD